MSEKKVVKTKTFTVTLNHYDDGSHSMIRRNDGFEALELLGVADFIALEVREQIIGRIKPDVVKREAVV